MDKIAILDFGSQFAHLLANRIRRLGVYSEILDPQTPLDQLKSYKALILSGGPASVNAPDAPSVDPAIFDLGLPILGVCYGHQLILHLLGGTVQKGTVGEYGPTTFTVQKSESILSKLQPGDYPVYASHFDTVSALPEGFEVLGSTPDDPLSATQNLSRRIYTLQFHPEVTHSACGMDILDAFVDITGAKREWSIDKFISAEIEAIHSKVGDKKVFLMISGGVDSSVAYVLLAKALGAERIYALYVDTGFMRKNETFEIQAFLTAAGVPRLHVYDAKADFFGALEGVTEPEQKRKIIGDKFLEIQRRVVTEQGLNPEEWLLGQGTIYPDTIESGGTKNADKIKTHHNRVPEVEAMIREGKVIEPLKELYKDEVRMVGEKLGLPHAMVQRHPFPGPGLAVRCLCENAEQAALSNSQNSTELNARLSAAAGPYTATVLPVKSVGVQGDERTYRHPVVLEGPHDWSTLRELSPKLTNSFREINRVLMCVATSENRPLQSAKLHAATLTPDRIALLQEADKLVMEAVLKIDQEKLVWQCPTVLLPLSINGIGTESLVLRPISSTDVMTANFTELPWHDIQELGKKLLALPGISAVFYDVTNKPPATIEWE
jgi:GMP synthase (glutamine-hydrolysing)